MTAETVCGLGNQKSELVNEVMTRDGVEAYPGSVKAVEFLQKQGYELHGSPFGSAECFGQALVKYEQAHPTGLPSTLQSHG